MALEEKLTKEQKALVLKEVIPQIVLNEISLLRSEFFKGTAFEETSVPTEREFIRIIGLKYFLFERFDYWKRKEFYEMITQECQEYNLKEFFQHNNQAGIYRSCQNKDSQSSFEEHLPQTVKNAVLYETPDSYKLNYDGKKESQIFGPWPPDNLEFFTLEELFPTNESTIKGNEKIGEAINFVVDYLDSNLVRDRSGRLSEVSEIVNDLKRLTKSRDYYSFLAKTIKFKEVSTIEELAECSSIKSNMSIIKRIGEGKGGIVYKVFSEELNQNLALKIIPSDRINPEEAKLMARIAGNDLENIVRIHDAGYHLASRMNVGIINLRSIIEPTTDISSAGWEGEYSILMEYVDGQTLEEILKERELTLQEILDYSAQILNGIQSLRRYNITHRDLNLRNIKVNSQGEVKILDFGIATDELHPEAKNNRKYGAPQGEEADDLISFGLLVYKMITGEHLLTSTEEVGSSTYANTIAEAKKHLREGGKLKKEYLIKLESIDHFYVQEQSSSDESNKQKELCGLLKSVMRNCLEGSDLEEVKSCYDWWIYGLYLMSKKELIEEIKAATDVYIPKKYRLK